MEAEEELISKIADALQLRRDIDSGSVVLLEADKVQKAFDGMMKAKVTKPVKPKLSENVKLWGLIAAATGFMFAAVVLSIWHTFL